jgi:hypothetical protein
VIVVSVVVVSVVIVMKLWSIIIFLQYCCCWSDLGLNPLAVPSLVILVSYVLQSFFFLFLFLYFLLFLVPQGTAKGGTTDLWHILQKLNVGFTQYETNTSSASSTANRRIIQTKKELNFYDGTFCTPPPPPLSSSSTSPFIRSGRADLSPCSASVMKTLLRCPRHLIDQSSSSSSSTLTACQNWLHDQQLPSPPFTMTASPSLLFQHDLAFPVLSALATETKASPLFILLLRDPLQRTISLYNHWSLQEAKTHSGYSLPLEKLLELELNLLSLPHPQRLLQHITTALKTIPRTKAALVTALNSHEELLLYMTQALSSLSTLSHGRLHLRSYGLVLDAWYLPQLLRWTTMRWQPRSSRQSHSDSDSDNNSNSLSLNMKGKLLILKSEEFLTNRLEVLQSELLPWLFPHNTSISLTSVGQRVVFKVDERELPKVQNQKKEKLISSSVSETMRQRLSMFYSDSVYPLEEFLYDLERRGGVRLVPPLKRVEEREAERGGQQRGDRKKGQRVHRWW